MARRLSRGGLPPRPKPCALSFSPESSCLEPASRCHRRCHLPRQRSRSRSEQSLTGGASSNSPRSGSAMTLISLVHSANFPGRVVLIRTFFRRTSSLAFLAASEACRRHRTEREITLLTRSVIAGLSPWMPAGPCQGSRPWPGDASPATRSRPPPSPSRRSSLSRGCRASSWSDPRTRGLAPG